ncbi:MAG: Hint domain-containing protein [Rhodospirillales bacterium]|nr:Hint domain-containing protein [Rhodospirillales bacterium]
MSELPLSVATIASGASSETNGVVTPPGSAAGVSWWGVATGTISPFPAVLTVTNGTLAAQIKAAGGSAAFTNATLLALGAPSGSAGLAVSGPSGGVAGDTVVSDLIAYRFLTTPLPVGESLLLWDTGNGNGDLTAQFSFTAADGNTPVVTTGWTYDPEAPFNIATGAAVNSSKATVNITTFGTPVTDPQAVVVVTPDSAITSVTVRAVTGITDTWGLAFATNATAQNNAPCFVAGTAIMTPAGPVPVERLRPGDAVLARFAGVVRVAWTGRRRVAPRRHAVPEAVWPIRIRRDAVAPGVPARDLLLSPDHAVFLGDVLIPARDLENGRTVVQDRSFETVEYWHVELARHDVLLAEALPAESYLDTGNRVAFENAGPVLALHPQFGRKSWEADACAPLCIDGPPLDRVRALLQARAGRPGRDRARAG